MDAELITEFVQTLRQFHRSGMELPPELMVPHEYMALRDIAEQRQELGRAIYVSDIQQALRISGSAVSQLLNELEQSGYILRQIDQQDRRKISVSVTQAGQAAIGRLEQAFERIFSEVANRMGQEDIRQLITLLNRLWSIFAQIKQEHLGKGDNESCID